MQRLLDHALRQARRSKTWLCGDLCEGDWQTQINTKFGTLPKRALDTDTAAHEFEQLTADCQAQSATTVLARGGAVGLQEMLKDSGLQFRGDADAAVFNAQPKSPIGSRRPDLRNIYEHVALVRELDGVANQVGQHLTQAQRVTVQRPRGILGREFCAELESLVACWLGKHQHHIRDHVGQVEVDCFELHVARFNLGEIQDVVDDGKQVLARTQRRHGPLALLRCQRAAQQQLVHAQHAVHWRANLMAHGGQKFTLGPVRRLGHFLGRLQVSSTVPDFVFQVVALLRQPRFALLDLFEHGVEASGLQVQLLNVTGLGVLTVVGVTCHSAHQLVQLRQRREHTSVQAP